MVAENEQVSRQIERVRAFIEGVNNRCDFLRLPDSIGIISRPTERAVSARSASLPPLAIKANKLLLLGIKTKKLLLSL
jgi:hypothetical protein